MVIFFLIVAIASICLNLYLLNAKRHHDGEIIINHLQGKTLYSLDLDINPDEIHKMSVVVFKVVKEESSLDEFAE